MRHMIPTPFPLSEPRASHEVLTLLCHLCLEKTLACVGSLMSLCSCLAFLHYEAVIAVFWVA